MKKTRKFAEAFLESGDLLESEGGCEYTHFLSLDETSYETVSFKILSDEEFMVAMFKRNTCTYRLQFNKAIKALSRMGLTEYVVCHGKLYMRNFFGNNEITVVDYGIYKNKKLV